MQNTTSPDIFTIDWERPDAEDFYLETVAYRTDTSFDALNRPKSIQHPSDINGERKMLLPSYNRAGALESVSLGAVSPSGGQGGGVGVAHIAYNAKGQRTLLALANGLMTRYEYEPDTFRLLRMRTEKCKQTGATFAPDGGLLQDLAYHYDLAGNITRIRDRGTGKGINGPATINRDYAYDALYRLTDATGIEHDAYTHATEPWLEIMQAHSDDLTQARLYRQQYAYDPLGNLLELRHRNLQGEAGHYTRVFQNATANNRLLSLKQGAHTYAYQYDPNGNMTRENTNRRYAWNHADQLAGFRDQPEGSAPTLDACYLYGADGLRVKKIVLSGGAVLKTSTYIGNAFEYHTRGTAENNTLHLMDDTQRIALWRIGPPLGGNAAGDPAIQYQLGDHLGSSSMTADETGKLIHREEFTPYGQTAFGGHAQKRYHFTGMERDEESGMQYHSARYYLPWIGRWGSCDPLAAKYPDFGGYVSFRDNPSNFIDCNGKEIRINFHNDESLKMDYIDLVNKNLGGKYEIHIEDVVDDTGYTSKVVIKPTGRNLIQLNKKQEAFYELFNKAIKSSYIVRQSAVENDQTVYVGSFTWGKLDISDLKAHDQEEGGISSAGALIHETIEQLEKAKMGLTWGDPTEITVSNYNNYTPEERDNLNHIFHSQYDPAHEKALSAQALVDNNFKVANGVYIENNGTITIMRLNHGVAGNLIVTKTYYEDWGHLPPGSRLPAHQFPLRQ